MARFLDATILIRRMTRVPVLAGFQSDTWRVGHRAKSDGISKTLPVKSKYVSCQKKLSG